MGNLFSDLRYSWRSLAKRPGFTAVAVLTLALGIGATTSIFTVLNAVLLRPLPFPDGARIVLIEGSFLRLGMEGMLLTGVGVAIGWAGALGAGQLLSGFLFGVSSLEPMSFTATPLLLAAVALLACYLPARRASKQDPMVALRIE